MDTIPFLLFIGSFFSWWVLFIALERWAGMRSTIFTDAEITRKDQKSVGEPSFSDQARKHPIFRKNTRSLDKSGNYREKVTPSLLFLKSLCSVIIVVFTICHLLSPNGWEQITNYLFFADKSNLGHHSLMYSVPFLLSFYLFESVYLLKYQKLNWSTFTHHWLTIISICLILLKIYFPIALWYGIFGVGLCFPISFMQGIKNQFGYRVPKFTRIGLRVVFFYYSGLAVVSILGAVVIIYQGYVLGAFGLLFSCVLLLFTGAWAYDDLKYAKALRGYGMMNYDGFRL